MPALEKVTDESIRELLAANVSQAQIAKVCRVSEGTISKRIKAMETRTAAKAPQHAVHAVASVWDTRTAAEENYRRALSVLEQECETPGDKIRAIGEIRQHLAFAMQVLETLYTVQETQAFMDEVMQVIEDVEPGSRAKILTGLSEKRTLRAAFLPH